MHTCFHNIFSEFVVICYIYNAIPSEHHDLRVRSPASPHMPPSLSAIYYHIAMLPGIDDIDGSAVNE